MEACSSKVTSKGQVVIPKLLREKYAIVPTTKIRWIPTEEGILMVPESADPIRAARGMLRGSGILKAYMKEKKREKQREERKLGKGIRSG
ncbi:MAG: AbrB/MazE/SpoVT family DNA-binding domain-containing protein [Deltaproteobacteria bacterium]|nr:AbrB/MazE/SpoVT family DNA-binding domain-containing protein [Deltaproteobacteria bacterium]